MSLAPSKAAKLQKLETAAHVAKRRSAEAGYPAHLEAAAQRAEAEAEAYRRQLFGSRDPSRRAKPFRIPHGARFIEVVRTKYPHKRTQARVHLEGPGSRRTLFEGPVRSPKMQALIRAAKGAPRVTVSARMVRDPSRTRLDLILDRVVAKKSEVTIDVSALTSAQVDRIVAAAKTRGLSVSRTRHHVLIRDLRGMRTDPRRLRPGDTRTTYRHVKGLGRVPFVQDMRGRRRDPAKRSSKWAHLGAGYRQDAERAEQLLSQLRDDTHHARRAITRAASKLEARPSWPRTAKDTIINAMVALKGSLESTRLFLSTSHLARLPEHQPFLSARALEAELVTAFREGEAVRRGMSDASHGDTEHVRRALQALSLRALDPRRRRGAR
jgi:hypothetical protein